MQSQVANSMQVANANICNTHSFNIVTAVYVPRSSTDKAHLPELCMKDHVISVPVNTSLNVTLQKCTCDDQLRTVSSQVPKLTSGVSSIPLS